jgi:protein-S-isoprenylcysteine O-methyltransferase Ste14
VTPPIVQQPTLRALLYAATLVWVASEAWILATRRVTASASVRDRGSRGAVFFGVVAGVWLANALAFGVPGAAIRGLRVPLFCLGILCMLAGIALRLYAVRVLGQFFTTSVATREGQRVVERGPYRWVRHPSYSGSLLTIFGLCLALINWAAFAGMIPPLLGFGYRIVVEERALQEALGDPYRAYMRRTRRLIPFLV